MERMERNIHLEVERGGSFGELVKARGYGLSQSQSKSQSKSKSNTFV